MEFRVLGPIEVRAGGVPLDLGGPKQRAVLARLLVARREAVAAERMLADVWEDASAPAAPGVLQGYISNLRRLIEPNRPPRAPATLLRTTASGYLLDVTSDADAFAAAVDEGVRLVAAGKPGRAVDVLERTRKLWRGTPFADVADLSWIAPEAARLADLRLVADEHRLAAVISTGTAHAAVPELERLSREHPLREELSRLLALALYRTGRQADALAVLDRTRRVLRDELGLDPSAPLRELEAGILSQSAALGQTAITVTAVARVDVVAGPAGDELIGRESELAELTAAAQGAAAGPPRAALIVGEPGVGKTALAESLTSRLAASGWQVVTASCYDTTGAPALWPWLQVLTALDSTGAVPDELQALIDATPHGTPCDGRFRQQEAVRRFLSDAAADRPVALVFDDVQWADAASLHLLADVITFGRHRGTFVLALMRPTPGPAPDALARLHPSRTLRLTLGRLTAGDVAELARRGKATLSEAELRALAERTGGNPFFVQELLRLLQRGGPAALADVPHSVTGVVRQQLGELTPEAQSVLRTAAVLGRDVDPDLLAAVSGEEPDEVWDALDAAVLAGLLTGEQRFRFTHDLVREAVVGDIPPLRRSRLHARAVAALEQRGELDVTLLAEHARAAGPLARDAAVRWATRAADQASARWAHQDAARWRYVAVAASDAAGQVRTPKHVELLLALVRAQLASGDAVGARDTRNQAVAAAAVLGDRMLSARALVALDAPTLWQLRRFDELEQVVIGHLEETLRSWPAGDDALGCRLMATLGAELYTPFEDPRSLALVDEAVAMARRLDDRPLLGYALNCWVFARARARHADECAAAGRELLALGGELHDPELELLGHQLLAADALRRFRIAEADAHARAADRLTERLGLAVPRLHQAVYWLGRAQLDGRHADAEAAVECMAELPLRWWAREPLLTGMRLMSAIIQDELPSAAGLIPDVSSVQPCLAEDAARLLGRDMGEHWTPVPYDWGWLGLMMIRALAATSAGSESVRRHVFDTLAGFTGQVATTSGLAAPVDWYLAGLARSLGDDAAARRYLAGLRRAAEREGLDWWAERAAAALAAAEAPSG